MAEPAQPLRTEAAEHLKAVALKLFAERGIDGVTVRQIAEAKMKDLSANDVEAAMQIILGSAKSMGIEVKG